MCSDVWAVERRLAGFASMWTHACLLVPGQQRYDTGDIVYKIEHVNPAWVIITFIRHEDDQLYLLCLAPQGVLQVASMEKR